MESLSFLAGFRNETSREDWRGFLFVKDHFKKPQMFDEGIKTQGDRMFGCTSKSLPRPVACANLVFCAASVARVVASARKG
jgi:hypothetical protein